MSDLWYGFECNTPNVEFVVNKLNNDCFKVIDGKR